MNLEIAQIKHYSSHAQKLIATMGALILLWILYLGIADTIAASHYVQIDQDIWSFLKYVGVVIGGLIAWGLKEVVGTFKNLVVSINALNKTVALNNQSITNIEGDVTQIKNTLEKHDDRIQKVEDKVRQN